MNHVATPRVLTSTDRRHPLRSAAPASRPWPARRLWCLVAAGLVQASHAADVGIALTAGPAQGRTDCLAAQPCDHDGAFAGLAATWRFDGGGELSVGYLHAGTFKGRDERSGLVYGGDFRVDALGLTAGYGWLFAPGWRLTGRAGLAAVRTRFGYDDPYSGTASKTTPQPLAGLGIAYALTPNASVGLDYVETRFKVHETHGPLRMPGISLRWLF